MHLTGRDWIRGLVLSVWITIAVQAGTVGTHASIRQTFEAGEMALKNGDLNTARASFLQILKVAPDDLGARVNLAVVYMREKNWDQALRYLQQAEQRAPQVTGIRLNIGLAEYRKGDYAAAIPAFQSVLRDDTDSTQARRLLGQSYLFEQRYDEAASTLEPLWPNSNTDVGYLYSLSVAAIYAHRSDVENKALAQLLIVGNDTPFVHLLRGKAYLARGDFDHALAEFQLAEKGDARLPLLHYNMGLLYRQRNRSDEARDEFKRDAAIEPSVAFDYDQLGLIAYSSQQDTEAEAYFHKALQLDPKLGTSWFGLAKVCKQQKRYPEALQALDRALTIDPDSASVHYLKAQVLNATGRTKQAADELEAVRRLQRESRDKLKQQFEGRGFNDPAADSASE